ncbi:MAG: transposase [Phycisphaerales bacterium]|nr:transposase [Phycisphaerales bacterium]
MNQHLAWISEHVRSTPGGEFVQVVLVLDRAGWHTSPKVEWPSNIRSLFLPPCSPELNGIERLWPRVRVKGPANLALPAGAELDAEGVRAWNRLTIDEIKSTCRTPWIERSN